MVEQQSLPRHQWWRRHYRDDRYGRHLSQVELNQRLRDLLLDLLHVDPDGKIILTPMNIPAGVIGNETSVWMEKWTHMLEEMQLRHGPYPAGFSRDILHKEPFPNFVSELGRKAAKRLAAAGAMPKDVFVKFGKRKYMEQLNEGGGTPHSTRDVFCCDISQRCDT